MKWSQKAREHHLEAGDRGKGEGIEGTGLYQKAPQAPHGPQRIHNSCWWTITKITIITLPRSSSLPEACCAVHERCMGHKTASEAGAVKALGSLHSANQPFLPWSSSLKTFGKCLFGGPCPTGEVVDWRATLSHDSGAPTRLDLSASSMNRQMKTPFPELVFCNLLLTFQKPGRGGEEGKRRD